MSKSNFVNWMIDSLPSETIIDAYFILSDLVDVNITESEQCESACYDSLAQDIAHKHKDDDGIPLGKLVL